MANKIFKLEDAFQFLSKSHRKAGDGLEAGLYPFFTSSSQQLKWLNEADYVSPAIILATGGTPSVHYADKFSTSADVFVIAPKTAHISIKYLYYFLLANESILERGFKGAGLKHLSRDYTKKIEIPIPVNTAGKPDIQEQRRIVGILEKAEQLKNKRTEADQKTNDLIYALFLEEFGDPIQNSKKWPKDKVGNFCKIETGNTPPRVNHDFYGNFIEWIKSDNILEIEIYPTKAKEGLSELGKRRGRSVETGAILMTCIAGSLNSIGNVCMTDRAVAFNQQINAFIADGETNPFFLYVLLKMIKPQIHKNASHVLKYIINKSNLQKIEVIRPPLILQNKFADQAHHIESHKEKQKKSAIEIAKLFSSLSSRAFSDGL